MSEIQPGDAEAYQEEGEPITLQLLFNTVYMVEDSMDACDLQDTPAHVDLNVFCRDRKSVV